MKKRGMMIASFILLSEFEGEYGAIVNWFHSECARLDEMMVAYAKMGDAKLKKMVLGYDAMTKEERPS